MAAPLWLVTSPRPLVALPRPLVNPPRPFGCTRREAVEAEAAVEAEEAPAVAVEAEEAPGRSPLPGGATSLVSRLP